MAVRIDNNTKSLQRTTNLPSQTNFTIGCFYYYISGPAISDYDVIICLKQLGFAGIFLEIFNDAGTLKLSSAQTGGTASYFSTFPFTANNWYFVFSRGNSTPTRSAGVLNLATGVSEIISSSSGGSAFTSNDLEVGNEETLYAIDGRIAGVKVWDAVLTDAEILAEASRIVPIRYANLNFWCPIINTGTDRLIDYSGNGRNFTAVGTLTDEDGPPVPYMTGGPIIVEQSSVIYSFARPIEDIASSNNWLTSTGSTRYTLIDEALADDTDYIYANTAALTSEVKVEPIIGPQGNILVSYKVQNIGGRGNVTVSMYAGSTLIKSDTKRNVADVYTMTVTSAEYSSVTDWSNIRLRFVTG